jgi:hypothetical protein
MPSVRAPRLSSWAKAAIPGLAVLGLCHSGMAGDSKSAYVRVSQVGYESGRSAARAYLMSTGTEVGATFKVVNSKGESVYSAIIGPLLGTWSHSKKLTYRV